MSYFYARNYEEILKEINERPSQKLTNRYVITDHAVRWEQIGRILGVKGLGNIKENSRGVTENCLKKTLEKWLQVDVEASWSKLENALNQAIRDEAGTGGENVTDDTVRPVSSSKPPGGVANETNGKDETDHSMIKDTGNQADQQENGAHPSGGQAGNGAVGNTTEDKIKEWSGRTKYPVIHKDQPLYSLIISNENFNVPAKFCKLDGAPADIKMVEKFLDSYGIHTNIEEDVDADDMKGILDRLSKKDFSKYSGLIITIITHGGTGNVLYGKDCQPVQLKDLAEKFNSAKCKALKNKPKIFIINACRGSTKDAALSMDSQAPSLHDSLPRGADFLFVHSSTDDYTSFMNPNSGSPFIKHLVTVLGEQLDTQHLENALLKVKEKVAEELILCDDNLLYKQMPSVVSQMRYEVWWAK